MDISKLTETIITFFRQNPVVGGVILLVVVIMAYRRPKDTFKLIGFLLFCVVAFYFITLFSKTITGGSEQKDRMIHKTREAAGE